MRNFEERRAEIFRRSENRIKARRRTRKSIIAVCVPLCLAVTVCSVVLFPQMRHKGALHASDETASYELLVETEDFESVVVTGSDNEKLMTIEERSKVDAIYSEISKLHNNVNVGTGVLDDYEADREHTQSNFKESQDESQDETQLKGEQTRGDSADENYATGGSGANRKYTICFTFDDGSKLTYELKNNELVNLNNNSRVRLEDEQVKEILQLFELV